MCLYIIYVFSFRVKIEFRITAIMLNGKGKCLLTTLWGNYPINNFIFVLTKVLAI